MVDFATVCQVVVAAESQAAEVETAGTSWQQLVVAVSLAGSQEATIHLQVLPLGCLKFVH
jgi:hypothetical protein